MNLAFRFAVALTLWPVLSACTATAPSAPGETPPRALVAAETHSDVGNDRPQVSFDGLMVRRRVILAIGLDHAADLGAMRRHLDQVARRISTTVSPISASVLDPVPLEQLAPDLVVSLPPDATMTDGQRLMDLGLRAGEWSNAVRTHDVLSALVHDLRFTVRSAHPTALARAIAREGILSDALGNYRSVPRAGRLDIVYTGPLLGDRLLHSVRVGIARRAHVTPGAVTVAPRTRAGAGVNLRSEPTPTPVEDPPSTSQTHEH
jgi:hypothetical protein